MFFIIKFSIFYLFKKGNKKMSNQDFMQQDLRNAQKGQLAEDAIVKLLIDKFNLKEFYRIDLSKNNIFYQNVIKNLRNNFKDVSNYIKENVSSYLTIYTNKSDLYKSDKILVVNFYINRNNTEKTPNQLDLLFVTEHRNYVIEVKNWGDTENNINNNSYRFIVGGDTCAYYVNNRWVKKDTSPYLQNEVHLNSWKTLINYTLSQENKELLNRHRNGDAQKINLSLIALYGYGANEITDILSVNNQQNKLINIELHNKLNNNVFLCGIKFKNNKYDTNQSNFLDVINNQENGFLNKDYLSYIKGIFFQLQLDGGEQKNLFAIHYEDYMYRYLKEVRENKNYFDNYNQSNQQDKQYQNNWQPQNNNNWQPQNNSENKNIKTPTATDKIGCSGWFIIILLIFIFILLFSREALIDAINVVEDKIATPYIEKPSEEKQQNLKKQAEQQAKEQLEKFKNLY